MENVPRNPNVLVGFETLDDAGVYRLNERQALVQTVDFITPIVDDPYAFGAIAVANALSDVYAMGGRPLTALNIVCFPGGVDSEVLHEILRGGLAKLGEAGVALLGGHSVDDPEIKYGLAVTGIVEPDRILTNSGAQGGDQLVLTKPLGIGVVTAGIKQDKAPEDAVEAALEVMQTLNATAGQEISRVGAHAGTDVTGFGLLGHLYHLARASGVTARVHSAQVPLITGALELAREGIGPGGTQRNKAYFGPHTLIEPGIEEALADVLFDPQTSGGLLISLPGEKAEALIRSLADQGVNAARVGEVIEPSAGKILVV